jgi:DNA-binding SARP family transcriptional activator/tetratricopeptide (TPR) repeat protein
MPAPLTIRLLGELEVRRGGERLPLPASKKTRALLGYLAIAGATAQPRQRLCELFWDGPDDPRAGLRWSLTKLRPLVDDGSTTRLAADRQHVTFEPRGAEVDVVRLRNLGSLSSAPLDSLRAAAKLARGELLEGLDLPDCYRYHEWCVAERERARRLCGEVLSALVERVSDEPEEALAHARARVTLDPLSEPAHVSVMQLLARLGRPREALRQYESCRRVLESQLGRAPSRELEIARAALGRAREQPIRQDAAVVVRVSDGAPIPLIGRTAEVASIASALHDASEGLAGRVLLFAGESGIGKSRLLAEAARQAMALGGGALSGRAFEAEMIRPYGAWVDLLGGIPGDTIGGALRAELAALLPGLGAPSAETDRTRLFDAVRRLLLERAGHAPLVVALDDLQWADEASVALLHYLARSLAGSRVALVCAVRAAEIDANPRLGALIRALLRSGQLLRLDVGPLDADGVRELVAGIEPDADAVRILSDGGGNPLFSIELARAEGRSDPLAGLPTLDGLIAERLAKLDERAAELLSWAAAFGRAFSVDALAAVASMPIRDVLAALEQLERHGIFRVNSAAPGGSGYDFAHDLVRRAAYRAMSEPRRRRVHLHVARTLAELVDPEGALAGDIAHHAGLGGDSELAARAYAAAGERCLRLFALADASRLAASGMPHAERLLPETAVRLRLALFWVHVHSNQWLSRSQELETQIRRLARDAEERAMFAEASRSYYLVSFLYNERGDFAKAAALSLQAADVGRSADAATRQHQLANTGRCLALIERDIDRADAFLREAASLGPSTAQRTRLEMCLGEGLLRAFEGQDEKAVPRLEEAAQLAAAEGDPWVESHALTRIARAALEGGRPRETLARCERLEPLVAKLSEGSEAPFVAALRALALLALGEPGGLALAEGALQRLRDVDSKAHVAYVLSALASRSASAGRPEDARRHAEEALRLAEAVGQESEAAVARSLLAQLALQRGDPGGAEVWLEPCAPDAPCARSWSARARAALAAARANLKAEPSARG